MNAMKKLTRPLAAAVALVLYAPLPWAADMTFNESLARDYQALSEAERMQGDQRDAMAYGRRGADAAAGSPTEPESIELRQGFLKDHYKADLSQARERLMAAFEGGGRDNAPAAAARAQTTFECWLEQASEDLQPPDIDACRQAFMLAVAEVEAAVPPPPVVAEVAPPMPPAAPAPYTINFGLDEASLDADAQALLAQIKTDLQTAPATRLLVVGYASRAGSEAHNMRLSQRRAEAVRAHLVGLGVQAGSIITEARGETDTLIKTGDDVHEPRNRRVVVTVER